MTETGSGSGDMNMGIRWGLVKVNGSPWYGRHLVHCTQARLRSPGSLPADWQECDLTAVLILSSFVDGEGDKHNGIVCVGQPQASVLSCVSSIITACCIIVLVLRSFSKCPKDLRPKYADIQEPKHFRHNLGHRQNPNHFNFFQGSHMLFAS